MSSDVIKIHAKKYWEIFTQIDLSSNEYFCMNQDGIDEEFLGIRSTTVPKMDYDQTYKYFKVVNKEKFLWIKLKYDL